MSMAPATPDARFVIGTAGHIDHGKTSLVKALTGRDLDTLPEERLRGITIALGFTHLDLPGGRRAAFIDVPGHERLVRTMIAGATGFDAVLLCVSAVEGVMPQTREHLAILGLLGVAQGLVVLTMADLVDDEMLELARMDVEDAIEGTFLAGAPIIPTAVGANPQGLDAVRAAIDNLPDAPRDPTGPFRMPVDRTFVQRGFGTIATGTVRSGSIADGEEVELLPEGVRARVRGLHVHGVAVPGSHAGQRTAVNLASIERDDLGRGSVIVRPGTLPVTSVLDVRLETLARAPRLPQGARVRLLLGTAEVLAVIEVVDDDNLEPGSRQFAQLRTDSPLVALPGDPLILRRESPVETIGGGVVLDPWAPRARKRDHSRVLAELQALEGGDTGVLLLRAGDAGLDAGGAALRGVSEGIWLGDRLLWPPRVDALAGILVDAVERWHVGNPLAAGPPRRELRRGTLAHLGERVFDGLIARLVEQGELELEGPRLRRRAFTVQLSAAQQDAWADALRRCQAAGLEGVHHLELSREDAALTHLLQERAAVGRVGDRLVLSSLLAALRVDVQRWLDANGTMNPGDFKELTGLSRRTAIPLLEWLDTTGLTRRDGDVRTLATPRS
jgi:selenocysteine-specific elongation factor